MGIFIWLYMLMWIFFSAEAKLLWEDWEDCNVDIVYKALLIWGVIGTWIGLYNIANKPIIFVFGLACYVVAIILKFYINKKYKWYC